MKRKKKETGTESLDAYRLDKCTKQVAHTHIVRWRLGNFRESRGGAPKQAFGVLWTQRLS